MTRDDIIRMALEADLDPHDMCEDPRIAENNLERFAALVRDYLLSTDIHSCHANCERFACVQTRKAVEAEREACAKVCEEPGWNAANWCAKQIRARGQA